MQSCIFHPHGSVFYHLINYLSWKSCPIDMLWKIPEIIENMIFSLIFVLRKYHISVNREKSRKYDIYVERFYENVVFHAVQTFIMISVFFLSSWVIGVSVWESQWENLAPREFGICSVGVISNIRKIDEDY